MTPRSKLLWTLVIAILVYFIIFFIRGIVHYRAHPGSYAQKVDQTYNAGRLRGISEANQYNENCNNRCHR